MLSTTLSLQAPKKKTEQFDWGARNIIGNNLNVNTENKLHKHAVKTVTKCINSKVCENLIYYFEVNDKATQN